MEEWRDERREECGGMEGWRERKVWRKGRLKQVLSAVNQSVARRAH